MFYNVLGFFPLIISLPLSPVVTSHAIYSQMASLLPVCEQVCSHTGTLHIPVPVPRKFFTHISGQCTLVAKCFLLREAFLATLKKEDIPAQIVLHSFILLYFPYRLFFFFTIYYQYYILLCHILFLLCSSLKCK